MGIFTWSEIKLPPEFYNATTSFAEAWSISSDGQNIVGTFGLKPDPDNPTPSLAGEFHGFLRLSPAASGLELFGSFDYPRNAAGATSARGVNNNRDIVGFYRNESTDRSKEIHGFIWRNPESKPIEVEEYPDGIRDQPSSGNPDLFPFNRSFPLATIADFNNVDPVHNGVLGINNNGEIVGVYRDKKTDVDTGYVWTGAGPQLGDIEHGPQVLDLTQFKEDITDLTSTHVRGINNLNDIVGSYTQFSDPKTETYGFKWGVERDSPFFVSDKPTFVRITDSQNVKAQHTIVNGINDLGWIVGFYRVGSNSSKHGFLWKPNSKGEYIPGEHITIDVFGATNTGVNDIANDGKFVGFYGGPLIGRHAYEGQLS